MVNQVIRHLIITFCILTLLFIPMAKADSRKASEDETKLAKTIEAFFTDWLIKRDVQRAMSYVSSNAIFSKTALPDEFQSKDKLSQEDVNKVFERIFRQILEYSQLSDKLETSISSSYNFVALTDNVTSVEHAERKLFEMVWIKEANDWRILTIAAIDD